MDLLFPPPALAIILHFIIT